MARVRSLGHAPALDGLRGIAILLVFAAHTLIPACGRFDGGTLGVDLFFVLSGFLITTLLLEERARDGGISFRRFYARRVRRLLPALLLLTGLYGLIALLAHPHDWAHTLLQFVARVSYLANIIIAAGHQTDWLGGYDHLWSLAQEEQFYLLWPPLLLLALRRKMSTERLLLFVGVAVVAINIDRVLTAVYLDPGGRAWVSPDTHGDPILIGCAAAILRARVRVSRWTAPAGATLAAGMLAFYDRSSSVWGWPIALPVFSLGCALFILGVVEHPNSRVARLCSIRPLRAAGAISYAWYLWNSVTIGYYGPAIGAPVSVVAATLSYRFVEMPFRRRRAAKPSRSSDARAVAVVPQPTSAA